MSSQSKTTTNVLHKEKEEFELSVIGDGDHVLTSSDRTNAKSGAVTVMTTGSKPEVPNMWAWENLGLYSQYAAVGLMYGSVYTSNTFCPYVFHGEGNLCSNGSV
jgi:hypothetical protein